MFGTVLEKLSGWFGQSFVLARFLPCIIFASANAAIAYALFPPLRPPLLAALSAVTAANAAGYLILGLGAVAVIAYTLSPFVRIAILLLEGNWMLEPGASCVTRWFGETLVAAESRRLDELAHEKEELRRSRQELPHDKAAIRSRLAAARRIGEAVREIPRPDLIVEADSKIKLLSARRERRQSISLSELQEVEDVLDDALRLNCAKPELLRRRCTEQDRKMAQLLSDLQRKVVSVLVVYARDIAESNEAAVVGRQGREFAPLDLAPTAFGNLSAALRSYCKTRYNIEFDYFWPRFLLVIQKNQTLGVPIANANVQVEFAVVGIALTALSITVWFAIFIRFFQGFLPLFIVAALASPAIGFWLNVLKTSYDAYADTVRSVIDLGRLEVLTALHQPLPPTMEAERALWDRLARWAVLGEPESDRALVYSNASGSAASGP